VYWLAAAVPAAVVSVTAGCIGCCVRGCLVVMERKE